MKQKVLIFLFCMTLISGAKAQFYSVKTNLIGLATANINAELSMAVNRKWSVHVPVQYNPLIMNNNRQFRNLTIQPGVRYWFLESYSRNFVGLYSVASRYHMGKIWDKYRYDGTAFGMGLSYGHAYPISSRWNIEWEVGAGVVWSAFDKYKCKECGVKMGSEKGVYLIPTRIAANIVYLF